MKTRRPSVQERLQQVEVLKRSVLERDPIFSALPESDEEAVLGFLNGLIFDESSEVRKACGQALGFCFFSEVVRAGLLYGVRDPSPKVRHACVDSLVQGGAYDLAVYLEPYLEDPHVKFAYDQLGAMRLKMDLSPRSPYLDMQREVLAALPNGYLVLSSYAEYLGELVRTYEARVSSEVVETLVRILMVCTQSRYNAPILLKERILNALAYCPRADARLALIYHLRDEVASIVLEAARGLTMMRATIALCFMKHIIRFHKDRYLKAQISYLQRKLEKSDDRV